MPISNPETCSSYSKISVSLTSSGFQHNSQYDFACFALWDEARPFLLDIRSYLKDNFEIILETEVIWSKENFNNNASRLYETPIYEKSKARSKSSGHAKKIGSNSFIIFIVHDKNPIYNYAMSVSRKIELSNLNIIKAKYLFRNWILEKSGVHYAVHSTNSIYEFYFQVPLLLGIDLFKKIIQCQKMIIPKIEKDLEGANGWSDYNTLFEVLNITSNYLVLRGHETLPKINPNMDLDVLTDNFQRFASTLGAIQKINKGYKGSIIVNGKLVSLDIRFVGDQYYDSSWQKNMLTNKVMRNGLFIPRDDDYFFSLLHHSKVQKKQVKAEYYDILSRLAKSFDFPWFSTEMLDDDDAISYLLRGYYEANCYYYSAPVDTQVYDNKLISDSLPTMKSTILRESNSSRMKKFIITKLPKPLVDYLRETSRKLRNLSSHE